MTGERLGVFGGTFDPPHHAHLALARAARDQLGLARVLWVPAGEPWQKAGRALTPAAQRAAMVALAIDGEPGFELERCELDRAGPSYTLDTVRELQARQPGREWYLVLGQDQYARLPTWHGWRELLGLVTLAVAARDGAPIAAPPELAAVPHRLAPIDLAGMPHASTRLRLERDAAALRAMVPPAVARYIDQHRLYHAAPAAKP